MGEFVKAFNNFLARDLVFIIGGGMVVTSFLYVSNLFNRLPSDIPVIFHLFGVGIAYVIGYALQDGFSLTPLVRTTPPPKKLECCITKWLYKRFVHQEWKDIENITDEVKDFEEITERIKNNKEKKEQSIKLERIVVLKQIGTTIGPCAITSGVIVFYRWFKHCEGFDLKLSIVAFSIGVLFVGLGWIKLAEQAQYLSRHRL